MLGTFLKRKVRSPSGNTLRLRDGLTIVRSWGRADVMYQGKWREVDLRPETNGRYRDLKPDEVEKVVLNAIDEVLAEHSEEFSIEDTGENSLLNPARFAEIYNGFEHNGLKLRVNYSRRLDGEAGEMDADVLDDDKIVGHITTNFARDVEPYVYLNEIRIDPDYQDRGFGGAISAHADRAYREGDIRRIDLLTDEVGGYAWARAGYEPNSVPLVVQNRMFEIYKEEGGFDHIPSGVPPDLADRWAEFMTFLVAKPRYRMEFGREVQHGWTFNDGPTSIAEVARWGSDSPAIVDGHQMWLGKWLLLGSQWKGSKRL